MSDDYFTGQEGVLENKLGIDDPDEFESVETEIVSVRLAELFSEPPTGTMDYRYLQIIHRRLFSDIYEFAGQTREVNIMKGGNPFCLFQHIDAEQSRIFRRATAMLNAEFTTRDALLDHLVELSSDLNALHPFREGNGRTIRAYLSLYAHRLGCDLDFGLADTQALMDADIAGFGGDLQPLTDLYKHIIHFDRLQ